MNELSIKILKEEYEKYGIQEYMDSLRSSKIKNSIINSMTKDEKCLYELRQTIDSMNMTIMGLLY